MPNYTVDNKTFTEKQVVDQAFKLGVTLEYYLANTGLKLEKPKQENVNWFNQTWLGRGFSAASATGEATDLLLEFDDVDIETVREIIKAKEQQAKNYVPSERMDKFQKKYKEEGSSWTAFFRGVKRDPALMAELLVQSLGTQIGTAFDSEQALVATATGFTGGAAAGSYLGYGAIATGLAGAFGGLATSMEAALTFGELIEEALQNKGQEFTDVNVKALLESPEGKSIRNKAIGRGLTIGTIETLTGGVAGKITTSTLRTTRVAGRSKKALAVTAGTSVEAVGGGLGEVGGRVVAGQEMDPAEIGFETITGTVTAPGTVGYALLTHKKAKYILNKKEVSYAEMKDFVDTAEDIDIAMANIKMENDVTGLEKKAYEKQNRAIIDSQIDNKITDQKDRNELIKLASQRDNAKADLKKEGVNQVPGAEQKLQKIENKISNIISKYESAVDIAATDQAGIIRKAVRDISLVDTIDFLQKNKKFVGKDVIIAEDNVSAQEAYNKAVEEYNSKQTDPKDMIGAVNVTDADGFVVGDVIVVNKDVAGRAGAINVGAHELLHAIMGKHMKGLSTEGKVKLGRSFMGVLTKKQNDAIRKRLKQNYELEGDAVFASEEIFTAFSDAITKGEITFNEGVFSKIKNVIQEILRKFGINKEFANGRQVYNFLKDYQKSIAEGGEISARAKKLAEGGTSATTAQASRSSLIEEINSLQKGVTTKADFQKPEVFNPVFESLKTGGAVNNYIRSLQMSPEKTQETIDAVTDRLINFDPAAKRKDGSVIGPKGLGEFIMANVGFGKKVAAKKLAVKAEKTKKTTTIDTKEAKEIADTPIETTQDLADGPRVLSNFNVPLEDGVISTIVDRVQNLIEQNPVNLKKRADKLVLNEIRKDLNNVIPKIGTPEYEIFIRDTFEENVKSISIVKSRKLPWFEKKKVGRKDYKNIDPETGKVSNYRKNVFESKASKPKYIKYYTQGSKNTLVERRRALILMIGQRKTDVAVDNFIEENSNNIDATTKAKLRTVSRTAELVEQELKTFDTIKFSKTLVEKTEAYFTSKENENQKLYRNRGFAFEQVIIDLIESYGLDPKILELKVNINTEKGGLADVSFNLFGVRHSLELKYGDTPQKATNVPMGSVNLNKFDLALKTYALAKDKPASYSAVDFDGLFKELFKDGGKLEQYINRYNELVVLYNNGVKTVEVKGTAQKLNTEGKRLEGEQKLSELTGIGDKIAENIYKILQKEGLATFEISQTSVDGQPLVDHYKAKVGQDPVTGETVLGVDFLEALGVGLYNVNDPAQSALPQLPWVKDAFTITSNIYLKNSGSIGPIVNGKKVSTIIPGGSKIIRFGIQVQNSVAEVKKVSDYSVTNKSSFVALLKQAASLQKPVVATRTVNNAFKASRTVSDPKGITVLDFDDTLATTKSLVKYTAPSGETGTLNAEEYASTYQDLLEQGYKFDFAEFNKVVKGKIAPLFQKALKLQGKFGPENMFVLTARPPQAQKAIFDFLKANGLNIPLKNITGLANSTAEAKALWIANKVGEGFNDFYFADDALQNVQAVDNMLEQFDVKRKVQQAKVKFSNSMSDEFNNILEDVTGIESVKRFDFIKARKRGASKGKFRLFIPPSHEDFVGLLYNFMGKGKKGNAHRDFLEQALVRPLNRANKEYDTARQSVATDYKNLNKQAPDVKKKLTKKTPGGDFTYQDAIRIYLWDKHGYDIPGLSPIDQKNLVDLVKSDGALQSYAETINIISKQKTYVSPTEGWDSGDIRMDLDDATGRIGRAQFFEEFIQNADVIFSEENLNKIEAGYGKGVRSALEDMLYRIKTGRNKPTGQNGMVNSLMNWVNGSVGSVMFFNMRSALLQQMSLVNYINFADNNIFAAAKAFANQKQYWTDWAFIFNSDMLKQRRGGIMTDVNGAELAAEMRKSKSPHRFLISKLLELGFLPTQIGDNIAIATGGATYYRNRINTYLRQGLSQKEAKAKAFTDFQDITQSTQQSARPDMVSKQQASLIGKIILNFQNVTSQFNRLGKKAFLDIKNRRITKPNSTQMQSDISNAARITYYFAVQNAIFYTLQTALFAMMFDDDEEDNNNLFLKKKERLINGSIDSILRGSGMFGAVISTLKNTAIAWARQRDINYNPDESAVLVEALNFSPVIGIKARKIVNAEKTLNYNKKVIPEMETFDIDNPQWSAVTNYIEAGTNLPLNRLYQKTQNVRQGFNNEHAAWERTLMFLGWSQYNLNLENKKMDKIKESAKTKPKSKYKNKYKSKYKKKYK